MRDPATIPTEDGWVTSAQSLLYAAPSDITIDRVRSLVKQVGPESPTLEYKAQMADTIAKGVAALANTYGGLLLVGVADDRTVRGVKEKTIESVAEHCAAKIEPPWVPEIIRVPLGQGSDLHVLVLRVVPGRHPRPLLVDGVAYVRHQNTTHPADWQRLKELFTEAAVARQEEVWNLHAPNLPQGPDGAPDSTVDFILRSGLNFTVAPEAEWRPLAEAVVDAFINVLNRSSLNSALRRFSLAGAPVGGMDPFHREGHNRSRMVRLVWWGVPSGWPEGKPGPIEASVCVEVPGGYGNANAHMRIEADVLVRYTAVGEVTRGRFPERVGAILPQWHVPPLQLGELMDALVGTLAGRDVVAPLADLSGIDPEAIPQPRVMHMVAGRAITEVLDTTGLRQIPGAGYSGGAHLLADPALDLKDDDDRSEQIRRWLIQIALDAGMTGMENVLAGYKRR
jgi:hypothetical protein